MPNGFRNNSRKQPRQKNRDADKVTDVDEQNPVLKAFRGYSRELDDKHDRNERIVKISRDITIESKRIIFLLHTIDGRKNNKTKVLEEVQQRLNKIIEINFKSVAKELLGQDMYQYRWAYSPGLQEFVEAYSFYEYCKSGQANNPVESGTCDKQDVCVLSDWKMLQSKMQYTEELPEKALTQQKIEDATDEAEDKTPPINETLQFEFVVDPTEYILGVADLTGELMRCCINSLGSGETAICWEVCKALQKFYSGYISIHILRSRELSRKITTMRQSMLKAENVCYNVKVRGGEAAKWGTVLDSKCTDEAADEGFF